MRWFYIVINVILIYELLCLTDNKTRKRETGFWILTAVLIAFLMNTMVAMIITVLQRYSLTLQSLILLVEIIALAAWLRIKGEKQSPRKIWERLSQPKYHIAPAALLLLAAFLYFGFPTKYMMGGRDPGLYFLNGIHIAETGSMQYPSDEYLNANYDELKNILYPGYPGLFTPEKLEGMSGRPGDISPQFLPMFPAILAVGFDVGGILGLTLVNSVVGILSLIVFYYFTKHLFSERAAVAVLLLMLFQPAQLWGVRITESEILSQLLFYLAMYLFTEGWSRKSSPFFIVAGCLLGISCMNRIDSYIYGVGLIVTLAYCVLWSPQYSKKVVLASVLYGGLGLIALLYGWKFSHIYIVEHWRAGILSKIIYINVIGYLMVLLLWIVVKKQNLKIPNLILFLIEKQKALIFSFFVLIAVFAYAYCIRPLGEYNFVKNSMVEFCWYTSVPMILLSIYGLYRIFSQMQAKSEPYFLFFLTALASVFVYIINPSVAPDHIWVGRRWITVNIPFIIILGCYGIEEIECFGWRFKKVFRKTMLIAVALFLLHQSRPFLFAHIMKDLDKQYEALANDLDENVTYVTTNQQIASYLKYIYNKNVYLMSADKTDHFTDYLEQVGKIHYIGNESELGMARFFYRYGDEPRKHKLNGLYLEKTVGRFPTTLYDRVLPANVYELIYNEEIEISLGQDEILPANGYYDEDGRIISNGRGGIVFYGPYLSLDPGEYEFSFEVSGDLQEKAVVLEIVGGEEGDIVATYKINKSGKVIVPFVLNEKAVRMEARLSEQEHQELICSNWQIRRIADGGNEG